MRGLLGRLERRRRAARPGSTSAIACASASSSSCLAWIMRAILRGDPASASARLQAVAAAHGSVSIASLVPRSAAARCGAKMRARHLGACLPMPPPCLPARRAAARRSAALPAQIGKYRVLRRLGEGATSEVFLVPRRLPRPRRRDQARARRGAGRSGATAATPSASSPPRRRWSAGCSTRTSCRSSTRWPTRSRPTW